MLKENSPVKKQTSKSYFKSYENAVNVGCQQHQTRRVRESIEKQQLHDMAEEILNQFVFQTQNGKNSCGVKESHGRFHQTSQNSQNIKKLFESLSQNKSMTSLKTALQQFKPEQRIKSFLKKKFQREKSITNTIKMHNGNQTYTPPPTNFGESLDPMARHQEFIGSSMSSSNGIDNLNISTSSSYKNTSPLFRSQQPTVLSNVYHHRDEQQSNSMKKKFSQRKISYNLANLLDPSSNGILIKSDKELHKLMEYMRDQDDVQNRTDLLILLKNTPSQNNRDTLFQKFVQFDGLDILAKWLSEGAQSSQTSFLKKLLDILEQIPITSEKIKSSKLGRIARKLNSTDVHVMQKLDNIIRKWKNSLITQKSTIMPTQYTNKRQSQRDINNTHNTNYNRSSNNISDIHSESLIKSHKGSSSSPYMSQNTTKRYKQYDATSSSSSSSLLPSAIKQQSKKKKKKSVRFCDSDNLERVRFFRREDPPNMRNLLQSEIQQAQKQALLNPHRISSQQLRQLQIDRGDALKEGFQNRISNQNQLKKMHAKIKWRQPVQYEFDQKYMLMDPSDSKQIEVQKLKIKNNFHGLIPPNSAIINPAEMQVKRFSFTDKDIAKLNACTVIESDLQKAAKQQQNNRLKELLLTLQGKSEEQVQELLNDYQLPFSYKEFKILLSQTKQKHRFQTSSDGNFNSTLQHDNHNFQPHKQEHRVSHPNSFIMPNNNNNNNNYGYQNFRNDKMKIDFNGQNNHMMGLGHHHHTHPQHLHPQNHNNHHHHHHSMPMYQNQNMMVQMPMLNQQNNLYPHYMNNKPINNNVKMLGMQDPQFQQRKSLQNILVKKKPPNYKTQPCRNFHSNSKCARGDTCHFIHDYKYIGRSVPPEELMKYRGIIPMNNGSQNQVPVIKFSEQLARENQENKL